MKPSYKELKAQAQKLAEEAERARLEEIKEVATRVAQELNEYEITLEDLRLAGYKVGAQSTPIKPIKTSAPSGIKYQNPANPNEVWTGRGRMPFWLKAFVDAGKDKESFKCS